MLVQLVVAQAVETTLVLPRRKRENSSVKRWLNSVMKKARHVLTKQPVMKKRSFNARNATVSSRKKSKGKRMKRQRQSKKSSRSGRSSCK